MQLAKVTYMRHRWTLLGMIGSLLVASCSGSSPSAEPVGSETVTFQTSDGETLEATHVGTGTTGVVIVHGSNANRTNWYDAGGQIAAAGFQVLIVNLRGTGESTGTRRTEQDTDILAAAAWLDDHGAQKIALIGSSMGATSVLVAATERPVAAVVALSPPQRSFAMDAVAAAPKITAPVMLFAAEKDTTFAESTAALGKLLNVEPHIVSGAGHGTGMFADNPDVIVDIITFLGSV